MVDIESYLEYANSPEAFAVLFVRKYLKSADTTVWVSVLDYEAYNPEKLQFKSVRCELVPRRTRPRYPSQSGFSSKHDYVMACRAATWEAANRDIAVWYHAGRQGKEFLICGVSYPKKKRLLDINPEKFFRPDAPSEIRALANDLSDRTDPLWDKALAWVSPEYAGSSDDGYVFKIRSVKRLA